jgi:hypothetical protein
MCYMLCPSPSSRFYHPHNIGWGAEINKLLLRKDIYQKLSSMLARHHCFFSEEGGKWYITLKNEWSVSGTKAANDYVSLLIYTILSPDCVIKLTLSFLSINSAHWKERTQL